MKRYFIVTCLLVFVTLTACKHDAESVEVRPETLVMAVGNTYQMHAKVKPDKASQHVNWSSTDASIATVSDLGMITAVRPGKCEIRVYAGDVKAACLLTVK
ncbi:MAG: Ig-like domain-containing protein [Bacteroidales bacterium]|nr:Ig-like domain-containing protein [Bacteroidales bacterium]